MTYLDVNEVAERHSCYSGFDPELQCRILDETALEDAMQSYMDRGGLFVDYHGCDLFPQEWFDHVIVLRTDNTILYDRLTARGYIGKKLENNVSSEIFQVILEEAHDVYEPERIHEVRSDTEEDIEKNVSLIKEIVTSFKSQQ